ILQYTRILAIMQFAPRNGRNQRVLGKKKDIPKKGGEYRKSTFGIPHWKKCNDGGYFVSGDGLGWETGEG
ncbi:MAG: hypothetical protein NTX88_08535, partial [Candidatus Atribacteria bacterium]|nr:hypothetical protein [Candidatus Atribacteria bacterium]